MGVSALCQQTKNKQTKVTEPWQTWHLNSQIILKTVLKNTSIESDVRLKLDWTFQLEEQGR